MYTNYFFFTTSHELNAQGENRQVLHALPNQTNYFAGGGTDRIPVRTEWKVQTNTEYTTYRLGMPDGTVFGTRIEGTTPLKSSLKVYTRNESRFYRVDELVAQNAWREDMEAAYRRLIGENIAEEGNYRPVNVPIPEDFYLGTDVPGNLSSGLRLFASHLMDRMRLGVVKFGTCTGRIIFGTVNKTVIQTMGFEMESSDAPDMLKIFSIKERSFISIHPQDIVNIDSTCLYRNLESICAMAQED